MKKISIGVPCYNEENNVYAMYSAIKKEMEKLTDYDYEIIFADNSSTDSTAQILKEIAQNDPYVKVIINQANYGPNRSGTNLISKMSGEAYIGIPCDFQEPPEMIPEFIKYWEQGYHVVWGQKVKSKENPVKYFLRTCYYKIIKFFSASVQYEHITGFGIQDRMVVEAWLSLEDPFISVRHVIDELGFTVKLLPYTQQKRRAGKSSFNIWRYLTFAINSLINTSSTPLRLITLLGVFSVFIFFILLIVAIICQVIYYEALDLIQWLPFLLLFGVSSIQLLCMGIIGEYVAVILRKIRKEPKIIEKELINFTNDTFEDCNR